MIIQENWNALIKPNSLEIVPGNDPKRVATLAVEPLERGFAVTLGNALRRTLLSSIQGAAVTSVQFDGALHEFSTLPGVREDVTEIILNIKSIAIRVGTTGQRKVSLKASGPGEVTAGQIETGHDVEIIDPDLVICTLDKGAEISMQITIDTGKGYVPAKENRPEDAPIGLVPVDAIFSPVRKVSYSVEHARVGQVTDYDKLILDVETDGSIAPEDAIAFSSRILQDQFSFFINFDEPEDEIEIDASDELPFDRNLLRRVEELELSVRSANCLTNDEIIYIGELVQKSEAEMLRTPNFGRKSLNEIKEILSSMNLRFGMEVEGWPPENIEELSRKLEEPF